MRKMLMMPSAIAVAVLLTLGATAQAADSKGNRPDGFGGVAFNATTEELLEAIPTLVRLGAPAAAVDAAAQPATPAVKMEIFQLANFPVENLGTCNLMFHTYLDRFAKIDFYCLDKDKVAAYLEELYGPAPATLGTSKMWSGENFIVYTPHLGTFSYTNQKLHDAMQTQIFLQYLGGQAEQPADAEAEAAPAAKDDAPADEDAAP